MANVQKYIIDFPSFTMNGRLVVDENLGAITFDNQGNTPVQINNSYILTPGRSLSIPCEENERDTSQYIFNFITTGVATPNNLLAIIRKTYKK